MEMQLVVLFLNLLALGAFWHLARQLSQRMQAVETTVVKSVLEESGKELDRSKRVARTSNGILTIAGLIIVPLIVIGTVWKMLPEPMPTILVVSSLVVDVAAGFIIALRCEWFG